VFKISVLPQNFAKIKLFAAGFAFLDQNVATKKISRNFPKAKNSG